MFDSSHFLSYFHPDILSINNDNVSSRGDAESAEEHPECEFVLQYNSPHHTYTSLSSFH